MLSSHIQACFRMNANTFSMLLSGSYFRLVPLVIAHSVLSTSTEKSFLTCECLELVCPPKAPC
jgi:hypothetical protein